MTIFKAGDEVTDVLGGNGVIEKHTADGKIYPLLFVGNNGSRVSITTTGKEFISQENPRIFLRAGYVPPHSPEPVTPPYDWVDGDAIDVFDSHGVKCIRVFKEWCDLKAVCYESGYYSGSTMTWPKYAPIGEQVKPAVPHHPEGTKIIAGNDCKLILKEINSMGQAVCYVQGRDKWASKGETTTWVMWRLATEADE